MLDLPGITTGKYFLILYYKKVYLLIVAPMGVSRSKLL